jgi:hypothetical protein
MPTIAAFDPPANINDMSPLQRQAWHETLSSWFDDNIAAIGGTSGGNRSQFYNPSLESTDPPSIAETDGSITWQGFPKVLENQYGAGTQQAWQNAEELRNGPDGPFRPQDEYLEWRTERDAAGQITRVTFTCEPPEYWEALAEGYPQRYGGPRSHAGAGDHAQVFALYRQLVGPQVQQADLFPGGVYDPHNRWNTQDGIVHLTQGANTLGAEINLAAQATVLRKDGSGPIVTENALINCSRFGTPGRASDPHIGFVVNQLAARGFSLTLLNPAGLYIHRLDTLGWTKPGPGNTRVPTGDEFWRIIRGSPARTLRAVYEVSTGVLRPDGQQMTVSDIQIGGVPIRFGGQIAKKIAMKLVATGCHEGQSQKERYFCDENPSATAGLEGVGAVAAGAKALPTRKYEPES